MRDTERHGQVREVFAGGLTVQLLHPLRIEVSLEGGMHLRSDFRIVVGKRLLLVVLESGLLRRARGLAFGADDPLDRILQLLADFVVVVARLHAAPGVDPVVLCAAIVSRVRLGSSKSRRSQ